MIGHRALTSFRTGAVGLLAVAALSAGLASQASAGVVVLTDSTFAPGNLVLTASNQTNAIIGASQCGAPCGSTGDTALQFSYSSFAAGSADLGVIDSILAYDPSTQGAISVINASALKNVFISATGAFTSTFRPIIEQGGNYYLAAIPLANQTGPFLPPTGTGYLAASGTGLTAADFTEFDFPTGATLSGHPDFGAGGAQMLFGIAQISSSNGADISAIDYDNYKLSVFSATPEAPAWAMMLLGVGSIGLGLRLNRRKDVAATAATV
jgi:hypothetical protein